MYFCTFLISFSGNAFQEYFPGFRDSFHIFHAQVDRLVKGPNVILKYDATRAVMHNIAKHASLLIEFLLIQYISKWPTCILDLKPKCRSTLTWESWLF